MKLRVWNLCMTNLEVIDMTAMMCTCIFFAIVGGAAMVGIYLIEKSTNE